MTERLHWNKFLHLKLFLTFLLSYAFSTLNFARSEIAFKGCWAVFPAKKEVKKLIHSKNTIFFAGENL